MNEPQKSETKSEKLSKHLSAAVNAIQKEIDKEAQPVIKAERQSTSRRNGSRIFTGRNRRIEGAAI